MCTSVSSYVWCPSLCLGCEEFIQQALDPGWWRPRHCLHTPNPTEVALTMLCTWGVKDHWTVSTPKPNRGVTDHAVYLGCEGPHNSFHTQTKQRCHWPCCVLGVWRTIERFPHPNLTEVSLIMLCTWGVKDHITVSTPKPNRRCTDHAVCLGCEGPHNGFHTQT